jgi:hypothetical protein
LCDGDGHGDGNCGGDNFGTDLRHEIGDRRHQTTDNRKVGDGFGDKSKEAYRGLPAGLWPTCSYGTTTVTFNTITLLSNTMTVTLTPTITL